MMPNKEGAKALLPELVSSLVGAQPVSGHGNCRCFCWTSVGAVLLGGGLSYSGRGGRHCVGGLWFLGSPVWAGGNTRHLPGSCAGSRGDVGGQVVLATMQT
jgi:hypothetical protein